MHALKNYNLVQATPCSIIVIDTVVKSVYGSWGVQEMSQRSSEKTKRAAEIERMVVYVFC